MVSRFKPVVGENAFSHESGIHIHGMLKNVDTYEVYPPETVGRERRYVLGKHAGKHLIQNILEGFGYKVSEEQAIAVLSDMKQYEESGCECSEKELEMLYLKRYSKK